MLKVENIEVTGWEAAIRGMRNPKNSWGLSDSIFISDDQETWHDILENSGPYNEGKVAVDIGPNDHKLMMSLAEAGPVHAKYRRMIIVTMDITAPLYWWKEFDTYKVGTVADSCSTMHKIHAKEFTLDDFSHEHLFESSTNKLNCVIDELNFWRDIFIFGGTIRNPDGSIETIQSGDKRVWRQMIQLLPSSYNQKRTVLFSYEVAANIHQYRRHHKLDEWHVLCDVIENLPYSEIILCSEKAEA